MAAAAWQDERPVPANYKCPITLDVMDEPVLASDGYNYEREALETHLQALGAVSPVFRIPLPADVPAFVVNAALRREIAEWREHGFYSIADHLLTVQELEVLGTGSTGIVYAGELQVDGKARSVAVKTLQRGAPDAAKGALVQELKVLQRASSECAHVVHFYGSCLKNQQLCLVMKRYHQSLSDHIRNSPEGHLDLYGTLLMASKLFVAIAELHELNIVSRDIKPGNCLLDQHLSLFLADFGIAGAVVTLLGKLKADYVEGTFNYMACEMFADNAPLTGAVDVWAGACCVLEMITGQRPFDGATMLAICTTVGVEKKHPPLTDVPACLHTLLKKCFAPNPLHRPEAASVARSLQDIMRKMVNSCNPDHVDAVVPARRLSKKDLEQASKGEFPSEEQLRAQWESWVRDEQVFNSLLKVASRGHGVLAVWDFLQAAQRLAREHSGQCHTHWRAEMDASLERTHLLLMDSYPESMDPEILAVHLAELLPGPMTAIDLADWRLEQLATVLCGFVLCGLRLNEDPMPAAGPHDRSMGELVDGLATSATYQFIPALLNGKGVLHKPWFYPVKAKSN